MRKRPSVLVFSALVVMALASVSTAAPAPPAKGGVGPLLASCILGPRVGQEMNEGQPIDIFEVLSITRLWLAYDWGYKSGGGKGFLASCCIGPRVGKEIGERKVRSKEKLMLVPIVNLYPWITMGMEAYSGKTMKQIEKTEKLRR